MAHDATFININSSLDALPFLIRPLEYYPVLFNQSRAAEYSLNAYSP